MSSFTYFASVILDVNLNKPLDYGIPDDLFITLKRGMKVSILLKGKKRVGYVFEIKNSSPIDRPLPILEILSKDALITDQLFDLSVWLAKYYCAPLSLVIKTILPSAVRKKDHHKEQLYVSKNKTVDELVEQCKILQNSNPSQARVIEEILKTKKGMLLTVLMEVAQVTRSPINTLCKKGFLTTSSVQIEGTCFVDAEYFQTKPKQLKNSNKRP